MQYHFSFHTSNGCPWARLLDYTRRGATPVERGGNLSAFLAFLPGVASGHSGLGWNALKQPVDGIFDVFLLVLDQDPAGLLWSGRSKERVEIVDDRLESGIVECLGGSSRIASQVQVEAGVKGNFVYGDPGKALGAEFVQPGRSPAMIDCHRETFGVVANGEIGRRRLRDTELALGLLRPFDWSGQSPHHPLAKVVNRDMDAPWKAGHQGVAERGFSRGG